MQPTYPTSAAAIARIRQHRKARSMSVQALADAITAWGYPLRRSSLANAEGGRTQTIALDLVQAAADIFGIPIAALLADAPCTTCRDTPPPGFACNACGTGKPTPKEIAE